MVVVVGTTLYAEVLVVLRIECSLCQVVGLDATYGRSLFDRCYTGVDCNVCIDNIGSLNLNLAVVNPSAELLARRNRQVCLCVRNLTNRIALIDGLLTQHSTVLVLIGNGYFMYICSLGLEVWQVGNLAECQCGGLTNIDIGSGSTVLVVTCGSPQVRSSQHLAGCIGYLAVSGISILTSTNGKLHSTVNRNGNGNIAIAVTVVALCTVEGYTSRQGRSIESTTQLLVGNLEVNELAGNIFLEDNLGEHTL